MKPSFFEPTCVVESLDNYEIKFIKYNLNKLFTDKILLQPLCTHPFQTRSTLQVFRFVSNFLKLYKSCLNELYFITIQTKKKELNTFRYSWF